MESTTSTCVLDDPRVRRRSSDVDGLEQDDLAVPAASTVRPAPAKTRLFYGWVMLPLVMLAMVASSPGQTFGVSIFNEPIRQSLGLSHGQLAAAYTLGTLFGAIPIMYIGVLMDRHGLRRTTLGVLSLFCAACLFTSLAQGWLMLTAAFFLLRMLGPGALSLLSGSALPFWFERRLGMVEGLRSVGHAGSMAVIPILNLWLVQEFGWRGGYAVLGAGIWLLLFPLYFVCFHNRPEDVGQRIDGGSEASSTPDESLDRSVSLARQRHEFSLPEALRTLPFWAASLGTATFGLIHTAIFFCLVPIFQERGLDERIAATTMMVFAVSLAVMQLIGGSLADRVRAQPLLVIGLTGLSIGVAMLYSASTPFWAIAAGLTMGGTLGIHSGAAHPLWARYFGRQHLGSIRGVLMTMNIGISSIGPLIAGGVRDWQGNFDAAMWVFIAVPLPLALLSCFAAPPPAPVLPTQEASAVVPASGLGVLGASGRR